MGFKKFKLMPERAEHFFEAIVFDSKYEMWDWKKQHDKEIGIKEPYGGFDAIVMPIEVIDADSGERGKQIGICLFHKEKLGVGLVSHEMVHCAMTYERIVNHNHEACFGKDCGPSEEILAYNVGSLAANFVNKLYEIGVYG